MNAASIAGKQVRVIRQQQSLSISCSQGGIIGLTRETERERALRIAMAKSIQVSAEVRATAASIVLKSHTQKKRGRMSTKSDYLLMPGPQVLPVELSISSN